MRNNNKKQHIIDKGTLVLKEKGFNGSGIAEIIRRAKIPKGSFYYYFKNKEQFAVEVLEYYSQDLIEDVNKILLNTNGSPVQRIIDLYSRQIDNYISKKSFPYGSFASMICQEIGETYSSIFKVSNKLFLDLRQVHVECIRQAIKAKELKPDANPEKLAELILYSWEGAVLRIKVNGNFDSLHIFMEMLIKTILK